MTIHICGNNIIFTIIFKKILLTYVGLLQGSSLSGSKIALLFSAHPSSFFLEFPSSHIRSHFLLHSPHVPIPQKPIPGDVFGTTLLYSPKDFLFLSLFLSVQDSAPYRIILVASHLFTTVPPVPREGPCCQNFTSFI